MTQQDALLEIKNLCCSFPASSGSVFAVNGLNLQIQPGEVHALIGESGCGKSVTARTILGLETEHNARVSGEIWFRGQDLLKLSERELRKIRGKDIAMIFQDPGSSLSPLMKAGKQIAEAVTNHFDDSGDTLQSKVAGLLSQTGLDPGVAALYPFELSGGMQQRLMIAQAIACSPSLLVADEATTALDVTIQKQILDLLRSLQRRLSLSTLFITHNFAVVHEIADRVSVMYAGQIVESAPVAELLANPLHPYTKGLIACIPRSGTKPLPVIPGFPPRLKQPPHLCPFAPRCPSAIDQCRATPPTPMFTTHNHEVRCHHLPWRAPEGLS
ncbi:MAG: ABC transporter ATP-binding protein [Spirochaetaceae bacterium]|jgi:peptide/nickel transport system ATP-binding protein|nr:ABC transporter ATP-binding protein [Spirochaetaceae bacterium]